VQRREDFTSLHEGKDEEMQRREDFTSLHIAHVYMKLHVASSPLHLFTTQSNCLLLGLVLFVFKLPESLHFTTSPVPLLRERGQNGQEPF
jgi:hypothetical protein